LRGTRASHGHAGADDAADAPLAKLGLESIYHRLVGELAHGQRQRVEIACVMATRPRLVLLDEPAAGMSGRETERTAELIKEINKDATVVVVEHDMQFIQRIAQQVKRGVQQAIDRIRELSEVEAQSRTQAWKVMQDRMQENVVSARSATAEVSGDSTSSLTEGHVDGLTSLLCSGSHRRMRAVSAVSQKIESHVDNHVLLAAHHPPAPKFHEDVDRFQVVLSRRGLGVAQEA
jgi:energy-coupling factor transporter ATP-binding protein EcfA2